MTQLTQLQTDKTALGRTRIVTHALPEPQPGEALLRISRLAVTTNNITYAAFGDTPHLRYWSFFPTGEAGWGHMPAWGFAEVASSTVAGLEPGERFYGYWPIASHLLVQPVRVGERGFYDGTPHRLELSSAYNQYQRVHTDAAYRPENEAYQMLLRPLFITSFMLADFLADNDFFGARQVIFSSASSKTAYGTAFCLANNGDAALIGLTSPGNRGFVEGLGCYSQTVAYSELEQLDPNTPTLYVDFSGDAELRRRVHHHFNIALVHDCFAGAARTQEHFTSNAEPLPGPSPQAYFAPNQIKKRNADWGPAEVTRRFNEAQLAFIDWLRKGGDNWMRVQPHAGFTAAQGLIDQLCSGRVDPRDGHIVELD